MKLRYNAVTMCVGDGINTPAFRVTMEGDTDTRATYGASLIEAIGMMVTLNQADFGVTGLVDADKEEAEAYLTPIEETIQV